MKRNFIATLTNTVLLSALFLFGCSKTDLSPSNSKVMFVNASFNADAVKINVDGQIINEAALAYRKRSPYINQNAGDIVYNLLSDSTKAVLNKSTLTLFKDSFSTLFMMDETNGNMKVIHTQDQKIKLDSGYAAIRFINLSPSTDTFSIYRNRDTVPMYANYASAKFSDYSAMKVSTADSFFVFNQNKVLSAYYNGFVFVPFRYYTIFLRGTNKATGNPYPMGLDIYRNF